MIEEKYLSDCSITFGANQIDAIRVGIAIIANALSITFKAKSRDVIEKINTKTMKIYWYIFTLFSPNKNFEQAEPY